MCNKTLTLPFCQRQICKLGRFEGHFWKEYFRFGCSCEQGMARNGNCMTVQRILECGKLHHRIGIESKWEIKVRALQFPEFLQDKIYTYISKDNRKVLLESNLFEIKLCKFTQRKLLKSHISKTNFTGLCTTKDQTISNNIQKVLVACTTVVTIRIFVDVRFELK